VDVPAAMHVPAIGKPNVARCAQKMLDPLLMRGGAFCCLQRTHISFVVRHDGNFPKAGSKQHLTGPVQLRG
jgi:hypothetical protein